MADSDARPALLLRDIRKSFGPLEVLKGVTLAAQKGEVIAILGASGSGKSTLLRCANLLELPSSGEIELVGESVRLKPAKGGGLAIADQRQVDRLRAKVAMVFQSFHLWSHMTILQNLIEAPVHVQGRERSEAEAEAMALLAKVGIAEKSSAYPAHMSGGQQQRAAIARALSMHPEVMLFDEPTSALDPERVEEVLQVIRMLAGEGRTMLLVTHELAFARDVASRVIFLHEGRIEEDGPSVEVFSNPRSERFARFLASHR
jgi:octopine/nopaline transport system ATP-binding protein